MPNNIGDVTFAGNTLLAGYQPPWVKETDPAWQQNIGYQFAGFAGIGMYSWCSASAPVRFARWLVPTAPPDWRTAQE